VRRLIELRVRNYRSLREATVVLERLTVLAGPHGAGKSNLLDVIRFLGEAARDDLQPALDRRGGYERLRFRGPPVKGGIHVAVDAVVTRAGNRQVPDAYALDLSQRRASSGAATLVREESFRFRRAGGQERRITVRGGEVEVAQGGGGRGAARLGLRRDALGLATLAKLSDDHGGDEVGKVAALFAGARFVDVDVEAARRPSPPSAAPLRPDAANLAAFLDRLAADDEAFAAYERDAQAVVPGLVAVEVGRQGDGTGEAPDGGVGVHLREMGLSGLTPLADASDGTVRALALLAAMHDPAPPALTCVEAFDQRLSPDAVEVLVERARAASERTQLLLTTHSPLVVDALKASELLACERGEDGATRFPGHAG
jgi:predicted ATPase